ncbi:MAG: LAGLIDADG family homing endonuclease [Bacilli bacterium]
MPYIKKEEREKLDHWVDNVLFHMSSIEGKDGAVNYVITRIIDDVYGNGGYAVFNRAMGVLECVKQELWDRKVRPYEDNKIRQSGDVYNEATPTERNLAWAAGLFEGEGCFYASYHEKRKDGTRIFHTLASVAQNDIGLLEQFRNVVGFGRIAIGSNQKTHYWYATRVGEAAKLLEWFRPWLSKRRIERAEELLLKESQQVIQKRGNNVHN